MKQITQEEVALRPGGGFEIIIVCPLDYPGGGPEMVVEDLGRAAQCPMHQLTPGHFLDPLPPIQT